MLSCHFLPQIILLFLHFWTFSSRAHTGIFLAYPDLVPLNLLFCTLLKGEPTSSYGFRIRQKRRISPMLCPQLQISYPVVYQTAWSRHPKNIHIQLFKNEFFILTPLIAMSLGLSDAGMPSPAPHTSYNVLYNFLVASPIKFSPRCCHDT